MAGAVCCGPASPLALVSCSIRIYLAVEVILVLFFVCSLMLNKVSGNLLELFTELFTWSSRIDRQSPKLVFSC